MKTYTSVSIVTVSYNAVETIEETIKSVLSLDYSGYEYIIIDGNSIDGTLDIIKQYENRFVEKGIYYFYISEPDRGIYDAMNKAIRYCKNEWIIYMNANDTFCDKDVLSKVFERNYDDGTSCIYGSTWNIKNGKRYFKRNYPIKTISYRAAFCHQALFVHREVLARYMFDESKGVSADQNQFVKMYTAGEKFCRIDIPIANFNLNGVSQDAGNYEKIKNVLYDIWMENGLGNKMKLKRFWHMEITSVLKKCKFIYNMYIRLNGGQKNI